MFNFLGFTNQKKEICFYLANKNYHGYTNLQFFARVAIYIKEMRSKIVTPKDERKCHITQIFIKLHKRLESSSERSGKDDGGEINLIDQSNSVDNDITIVDKYD